MINKRKNKFSGDFKNDDKMSTQLTKSPETNPNTASPKVVSPAESTFGRKTPTSFDYVYPQRRRRDYKPMENITEHQFFNGCHVPNTYDGRLNSDKEPPCSNLQLAYLIDTVSLEHQVQQGRSDGQIPRKLSGRRRFPQRLQLNTRSRTYLSEGKGGVVSRSEGQLMAIRNDLKDR